MEYYHYFVSGAYYPLRCFRSIRQAIGKKIPARLRALIFHDIAPEEQKRFADQLRWLARSWSFITPENFVAILTGKRPIFEDSLLLTFDDGFASNRTVVEKVLNPMGIKALFFVVSDFVDIKSRKEARNFISQHIWPGRDESVIPVHWYNMGWDDLQYLLENGHTIGAHTRTHARLSQLRKTSSLKMEIISGADNLENKLKVSVKHFAFPFGNFSSFSPVSLEIAMQRFPFIYTGLRGKNATNIPLWGLCRDAIKTTDSLKLIGGFLEGATDFHYRKNLSEMQKWVSRN